MEIGVTFKCFRIVCFNEKINRERVPQAMCEKGHY